MFCIRFPVHCYVGSVFVSIHPGYQSRIVLFVVPSLLSLHSFEFILAEALGVGPTRHSRVPDLAANHSSQPQALHEVILRNSIFRVHIPRIEFHLLEESSQDEGLVLMLEKLFAIWDRSSHQEHVHLAIKGHTCYLFLSDFARLFTLVIQRSTDRLQ